MKYLKTYESMVDAPSGYKHKPKLASPSEIKDLSGKDIHNELVMQISNIHPDAKKEVINYHKKVKLMDHQL
jgi:hypothetical protein